MSAQDDREEIESDARAERRLVPQALIALVVVVLVVIVRETVLR